MLNIQLSFENTIPYLSRALVRLNIYIVMMNVSPRHRYLEVIRAEHDGSALMAKVRSARACEHGQVRGRRGGGGHQRHGPGSGGGAGCGRRTGRHAGRARRRAGRARRRAHRGRHAYGTRTRLPRWS